MDLLWIYECDVNSGKIDVGKIKFLIRKVLGILPRILLLLIIAYIQLLSVSFMCFQAFETPIYVSIFYD